MTKQAELKRDEHDGYYWTKQDCPICELPPTRFVGTRGGVSHRERLGVESDIWSCGKCGLVFPNPMPFPMDGLGQHYEVDADEYFQGHEKDEKLDSAKNLVTQAEELLGGKGRLLDIGVGRGEILVEGVASGWEVEGVEPSESFADYAKKRTGAKIWREPIEDAAIPATSFDVVVLGAVLEHLYDPDTVMKKISEILKPGGLLYVDVPNEKGLYFMVGNAYQRIRGRKWCVNLAPTFSPFHVFGFGPESLKSLLGKHGLEPKVWRVYAGTSMVPSHGGIMGAIESVASKSVTTLSNFGELGTYIKAWAVKK